MPNGQVSAVIYFYFWTGSLCLTLTMVNSVDNWTWTYRQQENVDVLIFSRRWRGFFRKSNAVHVGRSPQLTRSLLYVSVRIMEAIDQDASDFGARTASVVTCT